MPALAASVNLEEFQVSSTNGFLPSEPPLEKVPEYYDRWESISLRLPALIQSNDLVDDVTQLPILSAKLLKTEPEWRRAYVLLGFIASGYLWGQGKAVEVR